MTHVKVITDERGTVNIEVRLIANLFDSVRYAVHAYCTDDDGVYCNSATVTPEEIQQAKTELWLKLKP